MRGLHREGCCGAQFLAILVGSTGRGYLALDSADSLLVKHGTLSDLTNRSLDEVVQTKGMKVAHPIRLAAAYEIGRRLLKEVARDA